MHERRYLASNGVQHLELLGRTGRLGAGGGGEHLAGLLAGAWSGSVTFTKCDTASAEDTRAVVADRALKGALRARCTALQA